MKKYCCVFLKGPFVTWVDFLLSDDAQNHVAFIQQMRFEGFAVSANAYVPLDEIRMCMFIQHAETGEPATVDFTKARMQ